MPDEKPQNLEFKVYCSAHNRLARLSFPKDQQPRPSDFSCDLGLSYPAGVICNQGGVPCVGYQQALVLFEKSGSPEKVLENRFNQTPGNGPQGVTVSDQTVQFSTETYRGFTICFRNLVEKDAYRKMVDQFRSFLAQNLGLNSPVLINPLPPDEEAIAYHNAQRSALLTPDGLARQALDEYSGPSLQELNAMASRTLGLDFNFPGSKTEELKCP